MGIIDSVFKGQSFLDRVLSEVDSVVADLEDHRRPLRRPCVEKQWALDDGPSSITHHLISASAGINSHHGDSLLYFSLQA